MATSKDEIWQALKQVAYPGYNRDIVSFGLVQKVIVDADEGVVTVILDVDTVPLEAREQIEDRVRETVATLAGVHAVNVQATKKVDVPPRDVPPRDVRPRDVRPRLGRRETAGPARPTGVRHVLAVGSGKGGVGKSTIAANLAVAFAKQGKRVGLMDADAYGPNVPRMMGVRRLPPARDGKVQPAEAHGVRLVSVGFLARPETPLIWRGPMTDKMVRQFLQDVEWGELDVLVVDLPPSTGDIPISLAKHTHVDGAVVVVTPQQVASDDAIKAIGMFQRLEVPVLGVIENMSYFVCDECETRHYLFGRGGGRRLAATADAPFLGEVPLETSVREGGDRGEPAVGHVGSRAAAAFDAIAAELWRVVAQEEVLEKSTGAV